MSVFKGNQVCVLFFKINIQQQAIVPKNLKLISIGKMAHAKKQIRNRKIFIDFVIKMRTVRLCNTVLWHEIQSNQPGTNFARP